MQGLDTAIENELPLAEHRLCCKHLHGNWGKKFPGKKFKDLFWDAARAPNVQYFEAAMTELKNFSVEAHAALVGIERKWARSQFRHGSYCDQLVNNWAEAFNLVIMRARDQPIITMFNTIQHTMMRRLAKEAAKAKKWVREISPRACETIAFRESKLSHYSTVFNGGTKYSVSTQHHTWVVELAGKQCSCCLWQLTGVPCIHAVCVYMAEAKDPRHYVHECYTKATQANIYNHFIEPIRGPTFWEKMTDFPEVLPPQIRVLPGRPKKCRTISAQEKREKAEKEAAARAKQTRQQETTDFKASRKGKVMHCTICHGSRHNARTCPQKKRKAGESSSQPTASLPASPLPPVQAPNTQPTTSRKSKKSRR